MRFADAIGAGELFAHLRIGWRSWNWRTVVRSIGERLIEKADAGDAREAAAALLIVRIKREWESKPPPIDAQLIGDHIVVAVPGRVVKFKRDMTVH